MSNNNLLAQNDKITMKCTLQPCGVQYMHRLLCNSHSYLSDFWESSFKGAQGRQPREESDFNDISQTGSMQAQGVVLSFNGKENWNRFANRHFRFSFLMVLNEVQNRVNSFFEFLGMQEIKKHPVAVLWRQTTMHLYFVGDALKATKTWALAASFSFSYSFVGSDAM